MYNKHKIVFEFFTAFLTIALAIPATAADSAKPAKKSLNVLIITVDDMSADSVGAFDGRIPDLTPNIDQLAKQGLRFEYAHVQVGNCKPSRNVMFSGLYPHNNRVEGFYCVKDPDYPVMVDFMKAAGYYTGIRGKVDHSTPYSPYAWDADLTISPNGEPYHIKDVKSYGTSTTRGIREAKEAGKPFCLLINISDPHRPFYCPGTTKDGKPRDPNIPSHVVDPCEVPNHKYLLHDKVVQQELANYYSSVRRADDCVGQIIGELKKSGEADNTVILFLSDHGMPLPFAKTQLYHHSSRTPWVVYWPGVTKPNSSDAYHMVSAVDLLPTLLDIVGIEYKPDQFDGRTFCPLIKGESQDNRDMVFKEYNENSSGLRTPMRAVQTRDFLYIYNPWSNGKLRMRCAANGTATYRQMKKIAETDPKVAARVNLHDYRVPQEFFFVRNDPDSLKNLVNSPKYKKEVDRLRTALHDWMKRTGDPLLPVFEQRDNPAVAEAYIKTDQAKSDARRANQREGNKKKKK